MKKIIDAHVHIFTSPSIKESEDMILKSMKKYNISYSLLSFDGSEYRDNRVKILYSQVEGSNISLEFAKNNKDKIGVLLWIRPHHEHNVEDIEKIIVENKEYIHGLKFHPYCSRLKVTSKYLIPYIELAKNIIYQY